MRIPEFLAAVLDSKIALPEQENFLHQKEEYTAEELFDAVLFLQARVARKISFPEAIDVCGTGGSGLARLNTSTLAAFGLAALEVKVAKHGNRAASGRFGSFDLLEKLGIPFAQDEELYDRHGLAFLFAPEFYPLMKHFAPVRTLIGKPTFFNLLGPLLNPAGVKRQIIGTAFRDKMELLAETCRLLGKERVVIVCGGDGLDEVTLTGATEVVELQNGKIQKFTLAPKDFGLTSQKFTEIAGGDAEQNTDLAKAILEGREQGPHLDLICANVALGLYLVGKATSLPEGVQMARTAFQNGAVHKLFRAYQQASTPDQLPSILEQIVAQKKEEIAKCKQNLPLSELQKNLAPAKRNFLAALQKPGLALIAEIKARSPSGGEITSSIASGAIAKTYEQNGATAISVLCDEHFFGGHRDFMREAAGHTSSTPILCKDFILDSYQIYQARKYGADAVLLIAAILSVSEMEQYLKILRQLKMEALVEVHTREELQKALATSAKIIGINARNLQTFQINFDLVKKLAPLVPKDRILVAESGITSRQDLLALPATVKAVLIGTAIMRRTDRDAAVREFSGKKPFLKICGVRDPETAQFCEERGVDLVGLNFIPESRRRVTVSEAAAIRKELTQTKSVGLFRGHSVSEVNRIAAELSLDFIQLCGDESLEFVRSCSRPVFCTLQIQEKIDPVQLEQYAPHVAAFIFDGPVSGSGERFDPKLLPNFSGKYFLAGGITPQNLPDFLSTDPKPFGVDVASGVETGGKIDYQKILQFVSTLDQTPESNF